jgi:hypothetical protein
MTIATSAPGTISSGTINQLPDWYTNYAKTVTTLGQNLAQALPNYDGYVDAAGNPVPRVAGLSGTQQQGIGTINSAVGSYAPGMAAAGGAVSGGLSSVQGASTNFGKAGDATGTAMGTINNGLGQIGAATGSINNMGGALQQAQSMLTPAAGYNDRGTNGSEYSAQNMAMYMNPYTSGVNNEIARLGNQNLTENVLPGVNSTFTGAGQFGSTRNGEFVSRALRDNQATITGAQSKVLADAQAQALQQAQAASTRDLQAGAQTGALGGLATNIAQGYGNQAGTQIQQGSATLNGAGDQLQAGAQYRGIGDSQVNQGQAQGALGQLQAQQAQMAHQMALQDGQAQLAAGQLEQNTNQAGLDAAHQDFMDRRDYPLQALGGLSQVLGGVSGKIQPNTQTVQVNQTQKTDPIQSISDIINGLSAGSK